MALPSVESNLADARRPGMGGSTPVPLKVRMKVWLESVPALLQKLDVQHVSLLCHSAGTIYGLNTLYYLRDFLDPDRPLINIIGPWVHNEHSHATLMNLASRLPTNMLDSWHSVNKFINEQIVPAASWSGGVVSSITGLFSNSTDSNDLAEKYGTSKEVAKEIERLEIKYLFAEDTTASDEEAKLCLKKEGSDTWMACADYRAYVTSLAKQEQERRVSNPRESKLKVQVYYAESDIMIGKGGQKYFEECWKQDDVSQVIDFDSQELPGTNHDSALFDPKKGALKSIFEEIKRRPE